MLLNDDGKTGDDGNARYFKVQRNIRARQHDKVNDKHHHRSKTALRESNWS